MLPGTTPVGSVESSADGQIVSRGRQCVHGSQPHGATSDDGWFRAMIPIWSGDRSSGVDTGRVGRCLGVPLERSGVGLGDHHPVDLVHLATAPSHRAGRWRAALTRPGTRTVLIILGAVVVGRLACFVAVLAFAPHGRNLATTIFGGDGLRYGYLAEHGYPTSIARVTVRSRDIAFFPLFPALAGLTRVATTLSFNVAASIVNLLASAVAAVLIAKVVDEARGPRSGPDTGMMTAILWVETALGIRPRAGLLEAVLGGVRRGASSPSSATGGWRPDCSAHWQLPADPAGSSSWPAAWL